jgi:hemerythrin
MSIRWDPVFAIGVAAIDAQHQELFSRIDAFLEAAHRGRTREELGELLRYLQGYVVEHFADEEQLMAEVAYPALAEHRAGHACFVRELQRLVRGYEAGGGTLLLGVMTTARVSDLLRDHIMRRDKLFAAFLAGQGGSQRVA